jgi:predicted CoA-binding protein
MEGVIIAVPPEQSEQAVRQALDAGSSRIWLQQGSESPAAVALCADEGVPVVDGACVLVYAQPVTSFCAFHRGICRVFGLLAK